MSFAGIRIEITAEAYQAIVRWGRSARLLKPIRSPKGGYYLLLDPNTVNRLKAARGPSESFSDTILRLAAA